MTPEKARTIFLDKPARRCREGHDVFYIPPRGGLVCATCSPGESVLFIVAVPTNRGKFKWAEFDPEWDKIPESRENEMIDWIETLDPGDIGSPSKQATQPTNPDLPPPQRHKNRSTQPIPDNRRCRLKQPQTLVSGITYPAGYEFKIQYTFHGNYGEPRASLLRLDGSSGIPHILFEKIEVTK